MTLVKIAQKLLSETSMWPPDSGTSTSYGHLYCYRIEYSFSVRLETAAGFPQGGILVVLLFSLIVSSLLFSLLIHAFTSDLHVYTYEALSNLSTACNNSKSALFLSLALRLVFRSSLKSFAGTWKSLKLWF